MHILIYMYTMIYLYEYIYIHMYMARCICASIFLYPYVIDTFGHDTITSPVCLLLDPPPQNEHKTKKIQTFYLGRPAERSEG